MTRPIVPIAEEIAEQRRRVDDYVWEHADNLDKQVVARMENQLNELLADQAAGVENYIAF